MLKILFFISELSAGGAEKVLCNLVNNMDQSKYDITVQTVYGCDASRYLKGGIHYKAIIKTENKLLRRIKTLWYRFCTEFKLTYPLYIKDDYDIEVAYLECGPTKVMAASTNKQAKKVAWVHCDLKEKGVTDTKTATYYQKYNLAVCVSQDVKKTFDELYGDCVKSIVLHNVIDDEEILMKSQTAISYQVPKGTKKLLAIGRLTAQKNFPYLIDICKKLKDAHYNFRLTILGDGPDFQTLQAQIHELHLEDYVELKGFISNPYPYIANCDYVVCSSRYEGISTVLQEALILNRIVVTTPCTGMRELLGDSQYGLIVEDYDNGLFDGLKLLFDHPEIENIYKERAKEKGQTLKKEYVIQQTESFFENLHKGK